MAASSSQRARKMVGSGALSHVYIQYPPFRCNIPGSSKMMYDDGNRLLLVPSPNKVFSWPVTRNSHPDSPSITTVDGGPVLSARFSLDGKILAIQSSDHEVSFFNRENGLKFKQLCRSRTERILGMFWTDCPTCDIVFVTSGGLELYSLASRLDSVKLVDVKPSQVSWFLYTHESRLVLLASGVQCKTFLCYQFSAGGIIRLPKFDASLRKTESSQKAVLGPEDVHIATMYGRLYCLQVDRLAMELSIYRFYRDAVVPQGMLPVYSESVAFSVVDGVLLVHQLTSKVVLLYDIFMDMKAPISAPLPLLLRGHLGFAAIGSASREDSHEVLNSDENNIYGDSWVYANPDIILDQAHGIMWRIHLDLEALAASSSDVPSLLAFLQRRRLDASTAKQLSLTVLRSIIVEKRPLSLISEAMDVINMAYSQLVRTRTTSTRQQPMRPQVAVQGGQARGSGTRKDVSVSSQNGRVNAEAPDEVGKIVEDRGQLEANSENGIKVSESADESDDIVEETEKTRAHEKGESSVSSGTPVSQNTPLAVGAISPEEMHDHVFAVIHDDMEVEPTFLGAAIIQYMRSAVMEKLKVPADLQALLIQLFARDERYAELMHFVRTKVLEPSKEVAKQLLQVGKSYPPIFAAGLNMLKQLSAHGDYLSAILQQGRLLEALRYARQNRVEAVAPATFLELAADSCDMQTLASVMRFCIDFVPSFESTAEYQKYSSVLNEQCVIAS
ncbi:hypothetical protein GOP47_0029706 [Adiantum capillus-veneris]|nr:hypothetical protein GOP47_0029411 [Adiantum capillus-veneris]KAI5056185.1 hypothetical protein GOP47_0029706 [Adiantum capillus-veneris]